MMLQSVVAGVIVLACGAHVGRAIWRAIRSRARPVCGGCASCEAAAPRAAVITVHRRGRGRAG
ncbi:MAG: hypothetical protein KIT35_22655 [Piscinibacter sp.]|uniref:hypothetical protein n=1 Tax=Piscinibacter TaxID=1114981 RepID=UPI000FDE0518|nr:MULTISPECIES: hypothetical protein [Piscinibacter]MCW5666642.1 hypothetical protein [Piscinibacter sp.]